MNKEKSIKKNKTKKGNKEKHKKEYLRLEADLTQFFLDYKKRYRSLISTIFISIVLLLLFFGLSITFNIMIRLFSSLSSLPVLISLVLLEKYKHADFKYDVKTIDGHLLYH